MSLEVQTTIYLTKLTVTLIAKSGIGKTGCGNALTAYPLAQGKN
ncbi:MAG: hypothetical protein ACI822_002974, partial [Gammaproteobacteria bacterium]